MPQVKEMKKQPRFIFLFNGKRITCSSHMKMTSESTMATDVSKRQVQRTHPELDPVVKKKQRQMQVVPNPNSRVHQSSSSIFLTTDYISNTNTHQSSQQATNATELYESKLENSQRKLHQGYEALDRAKKQRQIVVIGGKPNSTHKKSIPKGSRFKTKKLQRLYENHKTRPL